MPDAAQFDSARPYLSLVCSFGPAQRKPAWLRQARNFLVSTIHLADLCRLPVELLIVDRVAPGDETASALLAPLPQSGFAEIRIVTTEAEIIEGKKLDRERIDLNIGIRRARGRFIAAAGMDTIFGESLMRWLATRPLQERRLYHPMRLDMKPDALGDATRVPGGIEALCRAGVTAANFSPGTVPLDGAAAQSDAQWRALVEIATMKAEYCRKNFTRFLSFGNFMLMGRESWLELGGFPEWNTGDEFLDQMVRAQALTRGWNEIVSPSGAYYFAIPALRAPDIAGDIYIDAEGDPRIRIAPPPIRNLNRNHAARILRALELSFEAVPGSLPAKIRINAPGWGLAGLDLPEITISAARSAAA